MRKTGHSVRQKYYFPNPGIPGLSPREGPLTTLNELFEYVREPELRLTSS